jgi:hypothetical protein
VSALAAGASDGDDNKTTKEFYQNVPSDVLEDFF